MAYDDSASVRVEVICPNCKHEHMLDVDLGIDMRQAEIKNVEVTKVS